MRKSLGTLCFALGIITVVLVIHGTNGAGAHPAGPGAEPLVDRKAFIDQHALSAPPPVEQTLDSLAHYLADAAENDWEKARSVFVWITHRIHFDMDAYATEHPGQVHPEAVLRGRRAVCYGFAALFEALARRAGLEAVTIGGYAKGTGFVDENVDPVARRFQPNHRWNAVKIAGRWQLVDATRGAGYIKAQRFRRAFQEQYFLTPPAQLVRTHYPDDPRWQLLPAPITRPQFEAFPYTDAGFLRMGMKSETSWQQPADPGLHTSLQLYAKHGWIKVLSAPQTHLILLPGQNYHFLIEAPRACQVAVVQDQAVVPLQRHGTRFEGIVRPLPGELKLSIKQHECDPAFEPVLGYQVEQWAVYSPNFKRHAAGGQTQQPASFLNRFFGR